jgi:competence protein ComEA
MRQLFFRLFAGVFLMGLSLTGMAAGEGMIDINKADAATLASSLKGIGLKKAEEVVSYREQYGLFRSVDDLTLVRGIGPATVERNRDLMTVGDPAVE